MMNRRDALSVLTAGAAGAFGTFNSAFARLLRPGSGNTQTGSAAPSGEKSPDNIDDLLRKDLARLAPREYSEEGIPVFLACEDLVANKRSAKLSPLNAAISSRFRRNAVAWDRIRRDAPASDISKLIEVLADRDFANGGKEKEPANSAPTFTELAYTLAEEFATHPLIRAVNFHNTPRAQADQYERQIAQYSQYFSSVNEDELETYLTTGEWHKEKPGLIVSVFEGYRNSYDVLVPLLEKHGFVAWFFMITGFINTPVANQRDFAEHHDIDMLTHEYLDGRYALTWDELRQLDKKHVIASHTRSHTLLSQLDPAVQRQEVIGAQEDFKKNLGHPVRAFVSLTGPAYAENQAIDELIDAAGYGLVFSNFRVQRIRAK